jgi:O-antigen/teichoic acid export membrane protein
MEPKTGKSLTQNQSLRLNALSNWATFGVSTVVAFLLTPFIIRHLGKTGYGIWALVGSFTGYYGLLNLGVDSALTRYIARYAAQGDEESLNETASTAITMFCCTGVIVVIVSFLMAEPLARFFKVGPDQFDDFRQLVRIIGFVTGLSFPAGVFGAIIRAHEKFVAVNCAAIAITLLQSALVVLFLVLGWGLSGVALASLGGGLTALVVNYFLSRRLTPHLHIRLALAKWRVFRMLIAYGSVTTIIVVADLVRGSQMDSFVVGKWVGLSAVGVYAIASVIKGYVVRLVATGMAVLTPRFAALDGKEDHAQLRRLLVKALSISGFLSFGACLMAILFGKQFILWWIGEDFAEAAAIVWILTAGTAFAVSQNPAIGFLYALNKHYAYAIATIIEGVMNLALSIVLVHQYGMIGVAFGTLIPLLLIKVLIMPFYVSRIAGLSILDYLRPFLTPCVIAVVMALAGYGLGIVTRNATTLRYLLCAGTIAGTVYVGIWYGITRLHKPRFLLGPTTKRQHSAA